MIWVNTDKTTDASGHDTLQILLLVLYKLINQGKYFYFHVTFEKANRSNYM